MFKIGERVSTINSHDGIIVKVFKATGRGMMVHIKEDDGRIYFCPISYLKGGAK